MTVKHVCLTHQMGHLHNKLMLKNSISHTQANLMHELDQGFGNDDTVVTWSVIDYYMKSITWFGHCHHESVWGFNRMLSCWAPECKFYAKLCMAKLGLVYFSLKYIESFIIVTVDSVGSRSVTFPFLYTKPLD